MRTLVHTLIGVSAIAFASAASATSCGSGCDFTVTPGVNPYAGPTPTYTFDPGSRPGGTTSGNYQVGTVSGAYAQPYGTAAGTGAYGGLGYYYEVGPATSSPGIIDLNGLGFISSLSFIWGSVDDYNTLEILNKTGSVLYTIVGTQIFNPANGNQTDPNTNPLVTFTFGVPANALNAVGGLRLSSRLNAFEIDNLRVNVPEPATWAMMLLGFGAIGFTMRRRRRTVLPQVA